MKRTKRDLFFASFLMLFTELALIRWLGENVLYLSYFTNFILLASFLGIGIGFLRGEGEAQWFRWFAHAMLAVTGVVTVFPVRVDRSAADVLFLGSGEAIGLPIWVILPLLFLMTVAVLATVGHGVASLFGKLDALVAYRVDILGSVAGVVAFAGLAAIRTPPFVWGLVIGALYLGLMGKSIQGPQLIAVAGLLLILGIQSFNSFYQWSPYYQIIVAELENSTTSIGVNGIPHQAMASLEFLDDVGYVTSRSFDFLGIDHPANVLIIGAGSGNDVAYALRAGAQHVDAVEIDPVIYQIGVEQHPEHPYQDERVTAHIDDGRAFIERAPDQYDFILFTLTDSLTLVSGQSSLRLESFLFTHESVEAARELLSPGGVLAFYNVHSEQWVIDRMGRTLQTVFDQEPCYRNEGGIRGSTIAVGALSMICQDADRVDFSSGPAPATDDRPFLYVQNRGIPNFYLTGIVAIAIAAVVALAVIARGRIRDAAKYFDLLLMGAAFLLLETTAVVRFALWFGTTWFVNAIVFASVLLSVLLAIEVVARYRLPPFKALYGLLGAALIATWAIPAATLLHLALAPRVIAAAVLTFAPVFVANVIFAERFKSTSSSTAAFGANLIGAMLGGLMEYASLAVGYRNVTILIALLYTLAFIYWRQVSVGSV